MLAITLASVGGCGKGSAPSEGGDDKVIRVVRNIGGRAGFQKHVDLWKAAFEKANPGWKMEVLDLGNADAAEMYKAKIAADDLPEIVQTWSLTPFLADGGHLVPLPDGFYAKYGIPEPKAYKGKFYTSQGGLQFLGIAVNKGLCAKAGVTQPPQSWGELCDDLDKIKAAGIQPIAFGGREWSAAMPLSYLLQTSLYRDLVVSTLWSASWTKRRDAGKLKFVTDPLARNSVASTIGFLERFAQKGAASDGYNEEQRDFYGGKAAMWLMGCWIGGDVEPNRVDFEIEYWPIPGVDIHPELSAEIFTKPKFIAPRLQSGWAVTTSAKGEKLAKAFAVFDAFYQPEVYQSYLNAEAMFTEAAKVGVPGPKSDWKPAQHLYDSMAANYTKYGSITGQLISLEDQWPDSFGNTLMRVCQEILAGNRDVDKLLKMMDDDWDLARKAK